MTESEKPAIHESDDVPVYEQVRTEEPKAPVGQDEPNANVVSDATAEEQGLEGPGDQGDPGLSGYEGRDPKDEMPRVATAPDTQDDSHEHGAAPKTDREPPASN